MVKVCHLTSAHEPEDIRIFHKQCVSLAKNGYEVYLVAKGKTYAKNGVQIVGVGECPNSTLKRVTKFARLVYETALSVDADIYQIHDPELLPYCVNLKKKGKKVIYDSHEMYTEQFKRKPYLPKIVAYMLAKVYGYIEKSAFKKIDAVIFPCLKDGKHPFEGMCKRCYAINNVPILSELYDKYDPTKNKYEKSICYVGSITYDRGILQLIQATKLAKCHLYLAGSVSNELLQNDILTKENEKYITYLGVLNRDQIADLLQYCKVGMATLLNVGQYNKYDNLVTKAYEYMALGIPVVLSESPYNRRMVEQYRFGLCVDPNDAQTIANSVKTLLNDNDLCNEMALNGREAIKNQFNWSIEEKKLFDLYYELQCEIS